MTAAPPYNRMRELLKDDKEGVYHWKLAPLMSALSQAQREIRRMRPDLFLASDRTSMSTVTDPTATTDTIIIDEDNMEALALLGAAQALREDSESSANITLADRWDATARAMLKQGV